MGSSDIGQRIPCRAIDHNIDVQYVCIISFPVLSSYLESMRMNIDRDLVKQWTRQRTASNSVSWHMSPQYGHMIVISGYPVLTAVNGPFCEFPIYKMWTHQDTPETPLPPSLLIVSTTPPLQFVDAYVRTYVRSITWQPNEKRLTIFYEYGARRARGSPANALLLYKSTSLNAHQIGLIISIKHILNWFKILYPSPL